MHLCERLGYPSRRRLLKEIDSVDLAEWQAWWDWLGGWGPERDDERAVRHTAALLGCWSKPRGIAHLFPLARQREGVEAEERRERIVSALDAFTGGG